MQQDKSYTAHICMFIACAMWGLMAPLGKDAMANGISGLAMVTFRTTGAAICFWLTSLFTRNKEKVLSHDLLLLFFASMLGIVLNQCCFTIGLSITSPVNASIITTTMPIVTMILAAIFLKEPITGKKVGGIFLGASGALLLIMGSTHPAGKSSGNTLGDLLCLTAQCSFAVYLTLFKRLVQKYSVVTSMKWMFTYASIVILPFSYKEISTLKWDVIESQTWIETCFVVVGATFLAYILMIRGQKLLRPTLVSMYSYIQPIVACLVSVAAGLGVFSGLQAIAVVLVFSGVWLVTQSKSRAQVKKEKHNI